MKYSVGYSRDFSKCSLTLGQSQISPLQIQDVTVGSGSKTTAVQASVEAVRFDHKLLSRPMLLNFPHEQRYFGS